MAEDSLNKEKALPEQKSGRAGPVLKLLAAGIIVGVVLTTGASFGMKLSDQRPFCASCHIMNEAAITHKMSSHAKLACNECHAPHHLARKLPFKAVSGTKDVYLNKFGTPEEPIRAGSLTKEVVNTNCKNCHTVTNTDVASMDAKAFCTDCHRSVQHMRMKPIGTRKVSDV